MPVARALVVSGLMLILLAACSSGDGSDADAKPKDEPHQATTSTRAPQDESDLTGEIDDLLDGYNDAVNRIIADPTVVRDRTSSAVASYVDLFEPGSQIAAGAMRGWTGMADKGTTIKPINNQHPAVVLRLDGKPQVASPDEVRFATCEEHRYLELDAQGKVRDMVQSTLQHGQGVAVRTDGQWRIRDLKTLLDGNGCTTLSEGP